MPCRRSHTSKEKSLARYKARKANKKECQKCRCLFFTFVIIELFSRKGELADALIARVITLFGSLKGDLCETLLVAENFSNLT